ncbi:MAG: N-acetylmuramoyl-L-alanine amidase [Oscillospiraceae bacterium]|nr:N-acetylmuramoyl-L-alanine amidase [Oscillospiraceae bacterium]
MTKAKKNIIVVAVISLLIVLSIAVGVILNGGGDIIKSFMGFDKPDDGSTTTFGEEEPEPTVSAATRPDKFSGVWISLDDIVLSADKTVAETEKALSDLITNVSDYGFNTVFLNVLSDGTVSDNACTDGKVNPLSVLLKAAEEKEFYTCVVFESLEDYAKNAEKIKNILKTYDFDCIVLSGAMVSESGLKQAVSDISQAKATVTVAVEADSSTAEALSVSLNLQRGDFFVRIPDDFKSAGESYLKELEDLDSLSRKTGFDFAAGIRTDLIKEKLEDDAEAANLVIDQLALCDELDGCAGGVMFDYSEFSSDDVVGGLILKYMSDKNREDFEKEFELKNFPTSSKTTNESKITFAGSSSPLYDLKLNGKEVKRESNGDFSFEVKLEVGKNEFDFSHKNMKYKYTVIYEVKLLDSVSPTGTVNVPGKSSITITATALKDASVYATLNGQRINLKKQTVVQDEDGTMLDESSDFAVFSGKYTLPAGTIKEQPLGKIKVHASYNGISASLTGASVSVSAEIPVPDPVPEPDTEATQTTEKNNTTTGSESSNNGSESSTAERPTTTTTTQGNSSTFDPSSMLTPYKYAGVSGKSKMCEIISLCETMPANVVDDCVPHSSPLPAGTFDYISSEYTYGGTKYYRLASGKNILASKAKVISSGYNLPQNKVTVVSSSSDSQDTTIKLGLLWKGPFNISVKNQSYLSQSQTNNGSLYAVSSFNGKYLDLVFYHAGTVSGKVNVSGSKIISKAEWISDTSAKTLTLRMTLKTAGKFYGFDIRYTSDGCLTLSVKAKPSTTLKGSVIMIDAGHGGTDSGAICAYNPDSSRKYEKQLNLSIASKIKAKLEAQGATVIMTRSNDTFVSLDARASAARSKNPDMFISVHCDSSTSASPMGTSAYYYQAYSYPLASAIHKRIVTAYKSDMYYSASSTVKNKIDRGTNMYPFRVTRVEECPAVLIEYGFVSNIEECKLLWTSSVQDKLAQATVDGIKDYISSN